MEIDSENTRLLGPVEASPLPTSVLNQDDQEEEEEQQVPPLSSYCISAMYWAKQFRYPIFVVVGNLVSLVLTKGLFADVVDDMEWLREDVRHNLGTPDGSEFRSVQIMITVAFAISLFTFLADSYVCLQGARRMERKVAEAQEQAGQQDQPEEAEENSQEDVDFVKMSRSVDTAFGCTSNVPNATFFVCLLWALFSVAVSRAVNSGSSLVRIQLTPTAEMPQKELCFEPFQYGSLASLEYEERGGERPICSLQDSPMFASLPQDVQLWIKRRGSKHTTPVFNQSHSYIHVADGTMVFRFERGESFYRTFGLVVFSPRNNSAVEYLSEIGYIMNRLSASVELVGFPANPPYYGWCGIYKVRSHLILQPEVICYNGNTRQLKQFAAIKDTGGVYGWSYRDFGVSLYATEGTLWVASSSGTKLEKMGDKREIRKSLLAYDIRTMERTLAADRNVTFTEKERTSDVYKLKLIPECRGSYLTGFWSSIVALCLVSVYLYRLEVPSCALPASLAFASIMNLVLPATWASIVMLLCVCICLYFLVARRRARSISKYVTLEMMVWALYSLFIGSTFALWEQNHDIISFFESEEFLLHFLMLWVATAISVLLNHAIFKIFGVCYGIAGVLSCGPVFNGAQYLLTTVLLFTLSLGCFRVGTLLTLYRVHVIVHVRRACLGLKRAWSAVV